jgi:hypothetical protein
MAVTLYMIKHKCDKVCCLCSATPPCIKDRSKYCTCNRYFLSEKCFQNHVTQSLLVETSMSKFFLFGKLIQNMNVSKNVLGVTRNNFQAIFATWLH